MYKFRCKKCGKLWYSESKRDDHTCSDCGGELELVDREKPADKGEDSNRKDNLK